MAGSTIRIKGYEEIIRDIDPLVASMMDGRRILRRFFHWWAGRRTTAWQEIKATGGSFFGKTWPKMKDQYTRKTDGVMVPAWGGVPRIRHGFRKRAKGPKRGTSTGERMKRVSGSVSGKLRPSEQRVKQSSIMMQDTGGMRNSILAAPIEVTKERLRIGPHGGGAGEKYAIHQEEMRPVTFWTDDEEPRLEAFVIEEYGEQIRKFNERK